MTAKANPRKSDDRNIPTVDRPVRNQRACGTLLHPVEGGFEFLIDRCRGNVRKVQQKPLR